MDGIPFRQLSISKVSYLEGDFTKEEIKTAVFGLSGDHATSLYLFPTFLGSFSK